MTKQYALAIVDGAGRITEMFCNREDADEAGWGHNRELVQLVRFHEIGDVVDYDAKGVEIK